MTDRGVKRDFQQILASLWRMRVTICRRKIILLNIFCPLITTMIAFFTILTAYQPEKIKLVATDEPWVTSTTPNATQNNFYNADSGFSTPFTLKNCTLTESFFIGLVREDNKTGSVEGYEVLKAVFDELNGAYKSAYVNETSIFELKIKDFQTNKDLDNYVNMYRYHLAEKLCFGLVWQEYNPVNHTYILIQRWNFGDFYPNRKPQTEYEESLYSQLFLPELAQTGFLQTMTTVTSQIIEKEYEIGKDQHAFQLMYMPMNSKPFYNDAFSEVIGALLPLSIYFACNLASRFIEFTSDTNEKLIQQRLQRLGMRKSVELLLEALIGSVLLAIFIPLLTWMGITYVIKTTSFGFLAVNMAIYACNMTILSHIIKFLIESHVLSEGVEIFVEILQVLSIAGSYFIIKFNRSFILATSFLLPLSHMTWITTLAEIAKNKSINVELFQPNLIVNGNELTQVMRIALLSLLLKVIVLIYLWPIKISNDPEERRGVFYLCSRKFWRGCCGRQQKSPSRLTTMFSVDHAFGQSMLENEDIFDGIGADENLTLVGVTVEHNKHRVVDDLSLIVKKNEIFVFIGENGSGKSTVLQTIAGLTHVHSGTVNAFRIDLLQNLRFTKDNFLSISLQKEALIDNMTPEEQIRFCCRFMGVKNIDATIENILTEFNLKMCSTIITQRCSNAQRKSLSLALSLIGHSKIVLLDEPTAGMDISSKREIWEIIRAHKKNRIIIVATQDMQEANALGNRIGFLSHGKMTHCDTPEQLAKKLKHTLQLVFKIDTRQDKHHETKDLDNELVCQNKEEQKLQLEEAVLEAIKTPFRDKVTKENIRWNSLGKLIVRLPQETRLNDCIDMDRLHALQGVYFESVQVMRTSFDETFAEMIKHDDKKEEDDNLESQFARSAVSNSINDEVPYSQTTKVTYYQSLTALLKTEFYWTNTWRQMGWVFLGSFIIIGQETLFLTIFLNLHQPLIYYNQIQKTFEESLPILAYSNSLLPNTDFSTYNLTSTYKETVNAEEMQVTLLEKEIPGQSLSVKDWLDEAATVFYEESEIDAQGNEYGEPYGAYYIYQMDELTNNYSIGVYGNQVAAASSPTFGATMLNTLARKITGNQELKIEFINDQLPIVHDTLPSEKPQIAEVFGVSIFAAVVVLMDWQIKLHSKPINSGFYEAYLLKGGFPGAYICSKYLKCVLSNLVFVLVLFGLMYAMGFILNSAFVISIFWCFVNPLMVLTISSTWAIHFQMDYRFVQQRVRFFAAATGILAYISAGTIAFSQGNVKNLFSIFTVSLFFPPVVLLESVQWGFLGRLFQIITSQEKTSINLSAWGTLHQFPKLMSYLGGNTLLWGISLIFAACMFSCRARYRLKQVQPLEHFETINTAQDVIREASKVDLISEEAKETDNILTVRNLQCFKFLFWREVGRILKNNRQVFVVNRDLLGVYTVRGISFSVKKEERVVLLGANSSGASSLIQGVMGISMILDGEVLIKNCHDITSQEGRIKFHNLHGVVGYQPQRDSIDDELSVIQHLKLFSKLAGISREERYREVDAILEACCLNDLKDVKAEALTPGQVRRLSLGMALIGRPRLLILDNPLAGVDPVNKRKLINTILQWTEGRALLMSTRDVEEAELIADKLAIMHQGKLLAVGSVGKIIKTHCQGYTLEIQADIKKLDAQVLLIKTHESTIFSNSAEALEMLERIIQILDQNQEDRWAGLQQEFSKQGLLKDLFKEIDQKGYPVDKFIHRILILNLAFTLIDAMLIDEPTLNVNIDFAYSDILRISIKPSKQDFNLANFTEYIDSLIDGRAISSFTLNPNTIETVFSRLIQSSTFQAEKIKKAITMKHARTTFKRAIPRTSNTSLN